ncbi:hypothetical protein GVN24_01265 [Rhizobium sp. CRIBSB]|nr:hypothetical protein [Rhizobium sp. CRIBSB]
MTISSPRLIAVTMPASNSRDLASFYDKIFALNFGRTIKTDNTAFQTWISAGVKLNIGDRYMDTETTMVHLAVPNLADYAKRVTAAGGKVMTAVIPLTYHAEFIPDYKEKFAQFKFGTPDEVTETLGDFQICSDPQGNRFGIIQLAAWAEKLFEHGEISKIEIAEQRASIGHSDRLEAMEAH